MITCIAKSRNGSLTRSCRYGLQRLNCTVRHYANQPHPKKDVNTGTAYTLGAIALVGATTIGYAAYDQDFRNWMGENVPGADTFFGVIFQEKRSFHGSFRILVDSMKDTLQTDNAKKRRSGGAIDDVVTDYTPPRAVFPSLIKQETKEEKFNEIRVQNANQIDIVKEKPKPKAVSDENSPKSIADLEIKIGESATHAIKAYACAENAFKDYNRDVEVIIEDSVEKLDPQMWTSLKEKTAKKNAILKDAEDTVKRTLKDIERFKCLVDDPSFDASETAKNSAKRNIDRLMSDIRAAKDHYESERKLADITEKYWRKVEDARCHFIEELEILFPDFDISKKHMSLKPSDLDLFVIHAFKNVLYYQKEMNKLDTLAQAKLKQAIDAAKKGDPDFDIKEIAINEEIDRQRRELANEFQRKCLEQRRESEKELRHRLKCQEQAHLDHLADVLATREAELERDFTRKVDEKLSDEQSKYKTQMAGMVARMTGMRNAINERMEADKIAHKSQVLWSACQALYRAVKSSQPGVPWSEQVRPLQCELDAILNASAENDELVKIVLSAVPGEARTRGVFPEGALRERFLRVERAAKRLALVPGEGARLPVYLLSFLQATLLTTAANPIPQAELDDDIVDFSKLNTYDILQRARYWIDRGNYTQTLKYMNLLKGASRCIANEWIKEARILLETQQAAETLMAHAVAGGLMHI